MSLFECEMMFTATIGLKAVNDFLDECGIDEKLQVRDALAITVTQTLSELPSEEYLKKIAKTIQEHYENREINVVACRFSGYKNIRVMKPKEV